MKVLALPKSAGVIIGNSLAGVEGASQMPDVPNFYELLEVAPDAHVTTIRCAYRALAAKYHPDNSETGSQAIFDKITTAWKTLCDEDRRREYDSSLQGT